MDMDDIARLGYSLAIQQKPELEKEAFIRPLLGGAARRLSNAAAGFMRRPAAEIMSQAARHGGASRGGMMAASRMTPGYRAGSMLRSGAGAVGGFAQRHPVAAGLGAGLGALGAKDVASAATGGWSGEGNLGWHRQRMQGADYNSGSGGWMSPTAWGRTLWSPVKSMAAMFHGSGGPTSVQGGAQISGRSWVDDPNDPMQQIYQVSRSRQWSPEIQGKYKAWQDAKAKYESMRQAQLAKLDKASTGERGVFSRIFHPGTSDKTWRDQQLELQQGKMDSGDYGEGWFGWGPTASEQAKRIAELEQNLESLGAGSMMGGGSIARTPRMPSPGVSSSDSSRAARDYGLVPVGI